MLKCLLYPTFGVRSGLWFRFANDDDLGWSHNLPSLKSKPHLDSHFTSSLKMGVERLGKKMFPAVCPDEIAPWAPRSCWLRSDLSVEVNERNSRRKMRQKFAWFRFFLLFLAHLSVGRENFLKEARTSVRPPRNTSLFFSSSLPCLVVSRTTNFAHYFNASPTPALSEYS